MVGCGWGRVGWGGWAGGLGGGGVGWGRIEGWVWICIWYSVRSVSPPVIHVWYTFSRREEGVNKR